MKLLILTTLLLSSMNLFAIEGAESLQLIDCELKTESGIVEKNYPINRAFMAQSTEQATALFLASINLNALSGEVMVTSVQTGAQVAGIVKSVNCKKLRK